MRYTKETHKLLIRFANGENLSESNKGWTEQFEYNWSEFTKAKYSIAVNSGTSGLHAALSALDISPGDEVIIPGISVIMNAFTTINLGAIPIWVDVDPNTWTIDPKEIEKKITNRTKVITTISWFGASPDYSEIIKLAEKYGISILDDSAEHIQEQYTPRDMKGISIRVFSFEAKKHLTTGGEGGMVVTNDEVLAQKIRKFSGLGYRHLTALLGRTSLAREVSQDPEYERFDAFGLNYRMTPVSAAIGIGEMTELNEKLKMRKYSAQKILDVVGDVGWLIPQENNLGYTHSYYSLGLLYLGESVRGKTWKEFYSLFRKIGGEGFYGNVKNPYLEPLFYGKKIGPQNCLPGLCPISENVQGKIMAFKTNFNDTIEADMNAEILEETINAF